MCDKLSETEIKILRCIAGEKIESFENGDLRTILDNLFDKDLITYDEKVFYTTLNGNHVVEKSEREIYLTFEGRKVINADNAQNAAQKTEYTCQNCGNPYYLVTRKSKRAKQKYQAICMSCGGRSAFFYSKDEVLAQLERYKSAVKLLQTIKESGI